MSEQRAQFKQMTEGTAEDWAIIMDNGKAHFASFPDRLLDHLRLLGGDYGGFIVDRLTHSLQTATMAHRDGRDEEYVVCALLHDIGDILGPVNHPDIAAAVLQPFVSEQNHWMIKHHGIFQGYYFFEYMGMDKNMRDQFKDHQWYDYTLEFCDKYDQAAFDPDYDTLPLEFFEPMVRNVFAQPKRSLYMEAIKNTGMA